MSNFAAASAILGGAAGGGGGLLGADQGGGFTMSAVAAFRSYERDQVAARQAFADRSDVKTAIEDFKKGVSKLTSVEDLLNDRETLQFVLTGFGLDAEINKLGNLKAVINSDPDDINSYANRLADPRFGELAKFLDTPEFGVQRLKLSDKQSELIDKYLTNQFERSLGAQNPAARDALFFLRRINNVNNTFEILGDPALRAIVTDALNLPPQIARQSIDKQASLIERGLNLDNLKLNSTSASELTRLERLSADLGSISSGNAAIDSAIGAIQSIVDELESARTSYADVVNVTDPGGVNAAEIAVQEAALPDLLRQRGLVAVANQATVNTRITLDELETLELKLRNAEDEESFNELQATYVSYADKILGSGGFIETATFYDPASNQTQNLLLNGTVATPPAGIDAVEAEINTQVATDGTRAITRSTDLSDFLTDLQSARDAINGATFATRSADVDTASASFDTAETTFEAAEAQNSINVASVVNALNSVTFAKELDTTSLTRGQLSIDDGLERITTVERILSDIRQVGKDAQEDGADFAQLQAELDARRSELQTVIQTDPTVTDGTNTITLDNLLEDGTSSYSVFDTTTARAEGGTLITDLLNQIPTTISDAAGGTALESLVDDTLTDTLANVKNQLTRDRTVISYALEEADPRGKLDASVRGLETELDALIQQAAAEGNNLLGEFANDLKITLGSVGTVLTVDAQTAFETDFRGAIEGFDYVALSGGDDDARINALNDALFIAQGTLGRLKAESYALGIQREIITTERAAIETEGGSAGDFLKPIEFTDEALKFIERYLIQKDLENQGFSVNQDFNVDSALASQIGSILPQAGIGLNLVV